MDPTPAPKGCPRCGAPRAGGPDCPRCGVVYAKAERRSDGVETPPGPDPAPSAAVLFAREHDRAAARTELVLARFAVPVALLVAWLLVQTGFGQFLCRTFAGMWLHELGHAATAWLCGYPAFPGPWFTPVWEERSFLLATALLGGLGYGAWKAWVEEERPLAVAAAAALVLQLVGTLLLSERTAAMWITFGGDAGGMIFAAASMAAFFVPPGHKLHRDWLRWGLLAIGAAAFADIFDEWRVARGVPDAIAFGEIEGHGATDPTKLVDEYGWTIPALVGRYFTLGLVCLVALVPLQVLHVRRARRALRALEE